MADHHISYQPETRNLKPAFSDTVISLGGVFFVET